MARAHLDPHVDDRPVAAARDASEVPDAFDVPDEDLPRHVAIIMDGNRRWAREAGKDEAEGHAAGVEAIRPIIRHAVRRGGGLVMQRLVRHGRCVGRSGQRCAGH